MKETNNTTNIDNNLPSVFVNGKERILSVRPDTIDFRDLIYTPSLIEVPPYRTVEQFKSSSTPILNQGLEGACTGFGLATVANYLLRTRTIMPDFNSVSPRMLYEMAKRYDEWPGEDYEGSSARGAMKGWHKHGVCSDSMWPYNPNIRDAFLTPERSNDALHRPLGAYFRVNHKDIVAMHSAITEAGVLYATSLVHRGWSEVGKDGIIHPDNQIVGGHAFAIVGYDQDGFWIQNSWGTEWGKDGFGRISYGDWLKNASDVWVARLGVPIHIYSTGLVSAPFCAIPNLSNAYSFNSLRQHIISVGNNGKLLSKGKFAISEHDVEFILFNQFLKTTKNWKRKRLLIYAHGGLVSQKSSIRKIKNLKSRFLNAEIYPLFISWNTDLISTIVDMVEDSLASFRSEGSIQDVHKFMKDRLDESIEIVARLPGKTIWDEIKENAVQATVSNSGALRLLANKIKKLSTDEDIEVHLISHSAGSIILGPFVQLLASEKHSNEDPETIGTKSSVTIATNNMWAPACTTKFFHEVYLPLTQHKKICFSSIYTLSDKVERLDSCKEIYGKSLLYLVSNSFEDRFRPALCSGEDNYGEPILGMERFIQCDREIDSFIKGSNSVSHIISNDTKNKKNMYLSTATGHGEFDSDISTIESTIKFILNNNCASIDDNSGSAA